MNGKIHSNEIITKLSYTNQHLLRRYSTLQNNLYHECDYKEVEFLKKICDKFGFKYAVSSNSGSSANLLMISALMSNLYSKKLKNDEIIVSALAWSTSIFPLILWVKTSPVDCDLETMNIDIDEVKKQFQKKQKSF